MMPNPENRCFTINVVKYGVGYLPGTGRGSGWKLFRIQQESPEANYICILPHLPDSVMPGKLLALKGVENLACPYTRHVSATRQHHLRSELQSPSHPEPGFTNFNFLISWPWSPGGCAMCIIQYTGTHKGARAAGNYCPHVKSTIFKKILFKFKIFSFNHIVTEK